MDKLQQDDTFSRRSDFEARLMYWATNHSTAMLRWSLGLVFLLFGVLKFVPDASPAEDLSVRTLDQLTLGLVEGDAARILIATMEVLVGLSLLTGLYLKLGVILLGIVTIGIMAPLALFPGEMFPGPKHTPTLAAQYVIKDIVLAAAGIVVALRVRGAKMVVDEAPRHEEERGRESG